MNRPARPINSRVRSAAVLVVTAALMFSLLLIPPKVAAVAVSVPYDANPVADGDLDGDPATGDWSGASSTSVPLENAEAGGYGTATLYAKHDNTWFYFRIDGEIDVAWTDANGDHFWLAFLLTPSGTSHHAAGTWDGALFGLWDGSDYTPTPSYPPTVVDVNDFTKPPAKDASQDLVGTLDYTGSSAPYAFTAEWKGMLDSGDADDLAYIADGTTTYNFFSTTDSDGGGSSGGNIRHRQMTNSNTMTFAAAPGNTPPTVDLTEPDGGERWTGGTSHTIYWNMSDAETPVGSLMVWLNYSTDGGGSYSPIPGAQGQTGFGTPSTFSWALPSADTTQARVQVQIADGSGGTASDASVANFDIDSTAPTVTAVDPVDLATNVPISPWVNLTFSEAMNQAATDGAVSLFQLPGWTPVALNNLGWAGNVLSVTPASPLSSQTTFAVNVSAAAKDDSAPGNALVPFSSRFTTIDLPPTISVSIPTGGEVWTGGSTHNIDWVGTDPDTPAASWNVSLYYSPTGVAPWTAIAFGLPGPSGSTPWTLPTSDSTTTTVRATIEDTGGGYDEFITPLFAIDATPPTVAIRTPSPGQTGVPTGANVLVRFSEPMDTTDTSWFGLQSLSDLSWVVGISTWDLGDERLTFNPVALLSPSTTYRAYVNASTSDASDPGNPMGADDSWTFTTNSVADTTPPVLANAMAVPDPQLIGLPVNVSADVTDDVAVASVGISVTFGVTEVLNRSMTQGIADAWFDLNSYAVPGTYDVLLFASDTSGNVNTTTGQFVIIDGLPPSITGLTAVPDPAAIGQPVNVSADVTDDVAVSSVTISVTFGVTEVLNRSMTQGAGDAWFDLNTYAVPGTYDVLLIATDSAANIATAPGQFVVVDATPPSIANATAVPDPQTPGGLVNVSAEVTDTDLTGVWIEIYLPAGPLEGNYTAGYDAGTMRYFHEAPYTTLGFYDYRIVAGDAAGNWAETLGTFEIRNGGPPVISGESANPALQAGGAAVNVSAEVTDTDLTGVWIEIYLPAGPLEGNYTAEYDAGSGRYFRDAVFNAHGVHTFRVLAGDAMGDWAEATGSFEIDALPPEISGLAATPSPQAIGGAVNVSATVVDDHLSGVWIEVYLPSGPLEGNYSAGYDSASGTYFHGATYATWGTYQVRVVAMDSLGHWGVDTGSFLIEDGDPPVANAGPDQSVDVGTLVTFDGTGSTDNIGIENYTWVFVHGGVSVSLYGSTPSFLFTNPGNHVVLLTVRDTSALEATDTMSVQVLPDQAPGSPRSPAAAPDDAEKCIEVTWDPPADSDLDGYLLYKWDEGEQRFVLLASKDARETRHADCEVVRGVTYLYYVTAVDLGANKSPASEIASAKIPDQRTSVSLDFTAYLITIVAALGVVLAVLVLRRRRGGAESDGIPEEPSDPPAEDSDVDSGEKGRDPPAS